jgi:hypothetical protein
VRDFSGIGACLEVQNTTSIPAVFQFIMQNQTTQTCKMIWRDETKLGVHFRSKISVGALAAEAKMDKVDIVESFIADMLSIEHLSHRNRRQGIRDRITELERGFKHHMADSEDVRSVLQQTKRRAFQELSRHSPGGVQTRTAELYDDVFVELARRVLTTVRESSNGTFQVTVAMAGKSQTQVAKSGFRSELAASNWRDSEVGAATVKSILATEVG